MRWFLDWLRRNALALAVIGTLFLADPVIRHFLNAYTYQIVVLAGINIILAVSLNLISGMSGQFSLGHGGFMAIGAYVSAYLYVRLGGAEHSSTLLFVALVPVAGLAAAIAGLLMGVPVLRLRGDYLAIATLGFGQIVLVVILNTKAVGGALGLSIQPAVAVNNVFWTYLWVVVCIVAVTRLMRSPKGKALLAIREDEIAAGAVGIDATRYKVGAFTAGAFFAGAAGSLAAHYLCYLNPKSFDFMRSVEIVVFVVLGGLGSTAGAVAGAATLTVLAEALRASKEYRMVVYSALLVVMMLLRPHGLLGRRRM